MDAKSEGIILGVGAKIFTVAGPVILFGITSGVVYGVIYFIITLFS
jgi:stage V sporulation protein AC